MSSASPALQNPATVFTSVESVVWWAFVILVPAGFIALVTFVYLALPKARAERARFFLDILAQGLKSGRSAEALLVSVARSGDVSLGPHFHLVAAHLESGVGLPDALERVPSFLPPQITGMLRAAAKAGDLKAMLPACRRSLQTVHSKYQASINYHLVLLFLLNPVFVLLTALSVKKIYPVYGELTSYFGLNFERLLQMSELAAIVLTLAGSLLFCVILGIWAFQLAGPSLGRWVQSGLIPLGDWVAWLIPWRRWRMLNDFIATLAVLLDAGMHEAEAVDLAAGATGNAVFRLNAAKLKRRLEDGMPLPEALECFDSKRDLHWRFETALRGNSGFARFVELYGEVLESRAYRAEQAFSHFLSSSLVCINGAVALILVGTFATCISHLEVVAGR